MPVDYASIRTDNQRKYGEEIGRIGRMLLADRYDDRTHFIFEILQNTEDALKKRRGWNGRRTVEFSLSSSSLTISHFGKPFDEADVRGICGIGESTKALTDIGRFGIGFKSVYAFTDNPEIHSEEEHFSIDSYVWPRATKEINLQPEETKIYIPFSTNNPTDKEEILKGLRRLDLRALLFLREIEEVSWSVAGGPSGLYLRDHPKNIGNGARRVVLIGQDDVRDETEEWIVFSREVFNEGASAGHVEVAFSMIQSSAVSQGPSLAPVLNAPLVVFFPTVLSTNLGFIVQGPYRTTPSRDNVPEGDPWNRHLVKETAVLLVHALKALRNLGLLDVSAMECLPLDALHFADDSRLAPVVREIQEALSEESLLPTYDGRHVAGRNAKLARTQDLRALIGPQQLASLFPQNDNPVWLTDEITPLRTPTLHNYLTVALDIDDVTPEWLVSKLTPEFLEAQPDHWIEALYGFLSVQRALLRRLRVKPIVRLEDGSHTIAVDNHGKPQAYLPGDRPTGFPTVRRSVCQSDQATAFLQSLGLRVPDPVDDVIVNILPIYKNDPVDIPDHEYESDIKQILSAFSTDSASSRNSLLVELRRSNFIIAVDAATGMSQFVRPVEAYMATDRLTNLFEGVPDVLIVDNSRSCLQGENVRNLLRALRAPEHLMPAQVDSSLTYDDKLELRRKQGNTDITSELSVEDHTLLGLDPLLSVIAELPFDQASRRAKLLWQALCDLQSRRGDSAFNGLYSWYWYTDRQTTFPACFVKTLNEASWVPDKDGMLQAPASVVFKDSGWEEDPSLLTKIRFKPDVLNLLAEEAGIELGVLDLIKKHGLTSVAQMMDLLGDTVDAVSAKLNIPLNDEATVVPPERAEKTLDLETADTVEAEPASVITTNSDDDKGMDNGGTDHSGVQTSADDHITHSASGPRKFVSYVDVSPKKALEDTDGLSHQERMELERQAIRLILSQEPTLQPTPPNNPGFDLAEIADGIAIRWIEVKAMKDTLADHPVTLTNTQFKFAQERKDSYWLYVVENAGSPAHGRILRIRDPAGKAQNFSFDQGWAEVSEDSDQQPSS